MNTRLWIEKRCMRVPLILNFSASLKNPMALQSLFIDVTWFYLETNGETPSFEEPKFVKTTTIDFKR